MSDKVTEEVEPKLKIKLIRTWREPHMVQDSRLFEFGYGDIRWHYSADNLHAEDALDIVINRPDFVDSGNRNKLQWPEYFNTDCRRAI